MKKIGKSESMTMVLLAAYLVILTWIIVFKLQIPGSAMGHYRSINLVPFKESVITNDKIDLSEIIENVIVFIPVGVYIGMLGKNWSFRKKALSIAGLSIVYEISQYIFALGASDITDVIMNTVGGVAGVEIYFILKKIMKEKASKVINIVALTCTIIIVVLITLLLIANL